ncbi:MAG: hypothetical protein A3K19_13420 [Lentisphaerae bacterium RIFOXYB12_FULL_65_16]|nr:MAG: hypothetical protein A3K18_28940 [Lentisphaerae bacterium RIFOXYA12_64_32]OGV86293.1 MAG: hypothetical protein A3K19_13420 [Lentisphaerae bacterium RIFOXYB12_FULL_65_16]
MSNTDTPDHAATATTAPAPLSNSGGSRVVVAACPSYSPDAVEAALTEVLDALGGLETLVKPGQTVLIKPNLLCPRRPEEAVTTHPELVRQMIRMCVKAGAARIWVGDSPAGLHAEKDLWSRTDMTTAVEGTPAELKSWDTKQTPVPCGDDLLAVPEWFTQVDVVISLPKLKTHSLTTMTCALKNVFGITSGLAKSKFHAKYPSPLTMSTFLVGVFAALRPHVSIVDAVTVMEGLGPANGRPRPLGVLLASRDAVALDAVACAPLRIPPASVPMIRLAAARGLGEMDLSRIECTGTGVPQLNATRMKPSLARYLRYIPEPMFRVTTRLFQLRPRIQERQCVKCGICAGVCPRHAIATQPRSGYPAVNPKECIVCFCCMESCPRGAIAVQLYLGSMVRLAQRVGKVVSPQ